MPGLIEQIAWLSLANASIAFTVTETRLCYQADGVEIAGNRSAPPGREHKAK